MCVCGVQAQTQLLAAIAARTHPDSEERSEYCSVGLGLRVAIWLEWMHRAPVGRAT